MKVKDHLSLNVMCGNNQLRMVYTLSSTYIVPSSRGLRRLELARAPNVHPVASTLPCRTKCASCQVLLFLSDYGGLLGSVINCVVGRNLGYFCATAANIFSKVTSFSLLNMSFTSAVMFKVHVTSLLQVIDLCDRGNGLTRIFFKFMFESIKDRLPYT